jgi:hypothetical protein
VRDQGRGCAISVVVRSPRAPLPASMARLRNSCYLESVRAGEEIDLQHRAAEPASRTIAEPSSASCVNTTPTAAYPRTVDLSVRGRWP